jgi:hypothetical protein
MPEHSVCVTIYTCNRVEYAIKTISALGKHLRTKYPLSVHVADDYSTPDLAYANASDVGRIMQAIKASFKSNPPVSWTFGERSGYGGNYNRATQMTHNIADIHIPIEEDWQLLRALNIDPLIDVLDNCNSGHVGEYIGCIRLGNLGSTQELRGSIKHSGTQTLLVLDPRSPEPHVFAGHPRIETRDFQKAVGPWPENIEAGATEFTVAHRYEARTGVAWPLSILRSGSEFNGGDLFAHIGSEKASNGNG